MMINRKEGRIVRKLRRVLRITRPHRLKLSPETVMQVLEEADPGEIGIVELERFRDGKRTKHLSFKGVPIILCVKNSHHQQRLSMS